jgi:hypothetical protein
MDQKNIIITLTTIPSRLMSEYRYNMRYTLESLLNQSYDGVYEVHSNIPHVCKRINTEYVIPEWLVELEQTEAKLKIFRTEDYGPLTKLLPTVERIDDGETIIIVVDDDLIYHKELINEHINNRLKWPESPVGYDGIRSRNEDGTLSTHFDDVRDYFYSGTHRDCRVDVLQHYKSISYKRRFFDTDFKEFTEKYYSWSDDILISAYFASKKIDRFVTYYDDDVVYVPFNEWQSNVGKSFPILGNTEHERNEGCNIFRSENDDDNSRELYKFIDIGYEK